MTIPHLQEYHEVMRRRRVPENAEPWYLKRIAGFRAGNRSLAHHRLNNPYSGYGGQAVALEPGSVHAQVTAP